MIYIYNCIVECKEDFNNYYIFKNIFKKMRVCWPILGLINRIVSSLISMIQQIYMYL